MSGGKNIEMRSKVTRAVKFTHVNGTVSISINKRLQNQYLRVHNLFLVHEVK